MGLEDRLAQGRASRSQERVRLQDPSRQGNIRNYNGGSSMLRLLARLPNEIPAKSMRGCVLVVVMKCVLVGRDDVRSLKSSV